MTEAIRRAEATAHDGTTIGIEIHGEGPTLLLPVDPRPVEGPQADELRKWGADPALGQTLTNGLSERFRVVAFDYQGHVLAAPKPGSLTPDNVVKDVLAVADAVGAERFAWYGYSWLAVIGLQLAIRTDRLTALAMGGYPPLNGPYLGMLRVTEASNAMAIAQGEATAEEAKPEPSAEEAKAEPSDGTQGGYEDADWSTIALSADQTRQFVTFYEALQGFDDRAAQVAITCPRLCFVGSKDEMQYPPAFGDVHLRLAGPVMDGRAELESLGWEVHVLDGLDHMGAMLPGAVLPILRPWLTVNVSGP